MVLCFVRRTVQSPLVTILKRHLHCDCATRTDPNTGNGHLHSFRCNGRSSELPRCQETFLLGTFHSCIHVVFYNRVCRAIQEGLEVLQKLNYHRYKRNPRWPEIYCRTNNADAIQRKREKKGTEWKNQQIDRDILRDLKERMGVKLNHYWKFNETNETIELKISDGSLQRMRFENEKQATTHIHIVPSFNRSLSIFCLRLHGKMAQSFDSRIMWLASFTLLFLLTVFKICEYLERDERSHYTIQSGQSETDSDRERVTINRLHLVCIRYLCNIATDEFLNSKHYAYNIHERWMDRKRGREQNVEWWHTYTHTLTHTHIFDL